MSKPKFKEECIKNIIESILVFKQCIDIIDSAKPARAGALLGSQAMILTMEKLMKKERNKLAEEFNKKIEKMREKEDLKYVG